MKNFVFILISLGLIAFFQNGNAQDLHLSQYYAAPMHLNPALTGVINGPIRFSGNHKNQWSNVGNGYNSFVGAIDMPFKKWGLGAIITTQQAGELNYGDLNAYISSSYNIQLDENGSSNLLLGIQAGVVQKRLNTANVQTDEQYSSSTGYDPSKSTGENFSNDNFTSPDFNFGAMYFYGTSITKVNPFIGASIFHLLEPTGTFLNTSTTLSRRYVVHGGIRIKASKNLDLTPHAFFMTQSTATNLVAGVSGTMQIEGSDTYLLFGGNYRINDALIPYVGLQFKNYSVGISYDVNVSGFNTVTNYRGGYEFSFSYIPKRKVESPKFICPRL